MEIVLKEKAIVMMTRIVFLDLSVNLMAGGEMTFVRQVWYFRFDIIFRDYFPSNPK